ncbi:hypothetical protein ZWY2020_018237 [Hordeum vulgare]|nr:hypothetical protein ZWY2020_018237 [Hordeum vulgare]
MTARSVKRPVSRGGSERRRPPWKKEEEQPAGRASARRGRSPRRIQVPRRRAETRIAVEREHTPAGINIAEGLQRIHILLSYVCNFRMATEDSKDMLKNADWKTVSDAVTESSQPVVRKRLPKKIRQVPECYFLPRRSLPSALAIYGAVCAAGVGAGMLLEVWINKKSKRMAALSGKWANDVYARCVLLGSLFCCCCLSCITEISMVLLFRNIFELC